MERHFVVVVLAFAACVRYYNLYLFTYLWVLLWVNHMARGLQQEEGGRHNAVTCVCPMLQKEHTFVTLPHFMRNSLSSTSNCPLFMQIELNLIKIG